MMRNKLGWLHYILHLILWDSAVPRHTGKGIAVVANGKNVNSLLVMSFGIV